MKMKTLLKAAASAAVGALMLGATLSGAALAQNMGDLPVPFVQNGAMNALFGIGSRGTDAAGIASDLAGAIEVAASLGQATIKQTQATAAGGTVTIEQAGGSGLTKSVHLGQFLTKIGSESQFKDVLKHDDLALLKDTTAGGSKIIGNDGSSVDYHEELALDGSFSATDSDHADTTTRTNKVELYQGNVGISIASGSVRYLIVFDDSVDTNGDAALQCTAAGNAEYNLFPLKNIHFLGNEMEIKCSQFNGSMVVSLGQKMTLTQGQTITYGDYQVTLTGLDTRSGVDKALMTVTKGGSSESATLASGEVRTVFNGGLSIKVDTTFQGSAGAQATVIVGTNLDQTVSDGTDFMSMKGWDWKINQGPIVGKPIIGVVYSSEVKPLTGADIMKQGGSLDLPGGTVSVSNQGLSTSNLGTLTLSSSPAEIYNENGVKVTKDIIDISFQKSDGSMADVFTVANVDNSNATAASVTTARQIRLYFKNNTQIHLSYLDSTGTNWYETNYTLAGVTDFSNTVLSVLRYDTTLIYVIYRAATTTEPPTGNLTVEVRDPTTTTTVIDRLLRQVEQKSANYDSVQLNEATTAGSLNYEFDPNGLGTTILDGTWPYSGDYSNSDYALYTQWGMYVSAPKSDVQGFRLTMKVPNDRQRVKILVGSATGITETELAVGETVPGTTAKVKSVNAAGASSMEVVPISAPIAKTDSEISDTEKTSTNLLLFGGPSVNILVQQLGIQASEFKDASGNPIGKIKLVAGAFGGSKTACVVAGWDAINTRMASYVLAHYTNYKTTFAGKSQVTVSGTTTSALTVA